MNKLLLSLFLVFLFNRSTGQLVSGTADANTVINTLLGGGVLISNVSVTGNADQMGTFSNGSSIGMNNGIIFSTGKVADAPGPNVLRNTTTDFGNGGDADLNRISSGGTSDAVALEFDFVTLNQDISFEYVFGSDEYLEYVGGGFFDVMGFFLSGPGIIGKENLAVVGGVPVSIQSINTSTNSSLYIDNPPGGGSTSTVDFDGYTVVMRIRKQIICGRTYHMKIALADVRDNIVDSWVLIKGGSLSSGGPLSQIQFPEIVCAGQQVTASVTNYDPSYQYEWSNGQTGESAVYTLSTNDGLISVTIINPATGCSITITKNVTVHTDNNTPPMCSGPGGLPLEDYFITAGQTATLEVFGSDFNTNENITISPGPWDVPLSGTVVSIGGDNTANPHISVVVPTSISDVGRHCFNVTLTDNNACSPMSSTCTVCLFVACKSCKEHIVYDNRSIASGNPLPPTTTVSRTITAQNHSIVSSTENVTFIAGQKIELRDEFLADVRGEFVAMIGDDCYKPDKCYACCRTWGGFHEVTIPNVFTPNNDGFNDVWQVVDYADPGCAYGASCVNLYIYNRWGDLVYEQHLESNDPFECCPFKSPSSPDDPLIASVFWDGRTDHGDPVSDGTYFYVLDFCSNCTDQIRSYHGTITVLGIDLAPALIAPVEPPLIDIPVGNNPRTLLDNVASEYSIYPNTNNGIFYVSSSTTMEAFNIELFDNQGTMILSQRDIATPMYKINISDRNNGVYFLRIFDSQNSKIHKVIKE